MSEFFRRLTRQSTRKQTEQLEKEVKERAEKEKDESSKRFSILESRKKTKDYNLDKLKQFFNLKLSQEEKETFTKDFTQQYMWDYELWKDYLLDSIEKDDFNAVLFYLEKVTNFSSKRKTIQYDIDDMYFMTELLDKMRDMKRGYLFWDRPYWTRLKNIINPDTDWWLNHIYNSLQESTYIKKLLENSWKVISWKLIIKASYMNQSTITYIINYIYEKDDLMEHRFNGNTYQLGMLMALHSDKITASQKENIRFYLNYLILKRARTLPPLVFNVSQTLDGLPTYTLDTGLYQFIIQCLEMNETNILEQFVKVFDIKRTENDEWFKFLIECIIRPEYVKRQGIISSSIKINDIKKLVSYIIKAYKININNIYFSQKDLFLGDQPEDPIRNPKIWLDKNIPVIAWAVLYKNIDAIDYLLYHGAKLNRCVIAMQDLTTDPAILSRFDREHKATKIQRAFTEHLYSPSHPSHQRRIASYKEKYQAAQSISPIQEEQSGGKNKKKQKKRV